MANKKKFNRALFFGDLIFFIIFTFFLLSTSFFEFYKELGIKNYVIIGSVLGIVFTMLLGLWLATSKRSFLKAI